MMKRYFNTLLVFSTVTFSPLMLAEGDPGTGEEVYDLWCIHCHADVEGYAGTHMLSLTRGESLAVMKDNETLVPEYIEVVVRKGLGMMPPIRQVEVTDEQLEDLTAYILSDR